MKNLIFDLDPLFKMVFERLVGEGEDLANALLQ